MMRAQDLIAVHESDLMTVTFYANGYDDEYSNGMDIEDIEVAEVTIMGETVDLDAMPKAIADAIYRLSDEVEFERI